MKIRTAAKAAAIVRNFKILSSHRLLHRRMSCKAIRNAQQSTTDRLRKSVEYYGGIRPNITALMLAVIVLVIAAGCGQAAPTSSAASTSRPLVPGEQLWPTGASSLLYGINQSVDWSSKNLENTPAAQDILKRT